MNSQMTRFARGSKCVSLGANGLADSADDSPANIAASAIPPKPLLAREKNSRRVELSAFQVGDEPGMFRNDPQQDFVKIRDHSETAI